MAQIRPFSCIRPAAEAASRVAALPYDVYNRKEAKEEARKDPLSFLNIDRPETQFADDQDMYADEVYQKAAELFEGQILAGTYIEDPEECYYIYELTMNGRTQTGIVGCASIDDYISGVILKHENTREEKELDRIRHVDTLSAQTGPIFLACRTNDAIRRVTEAVKKGEPLYDFVSEDGIGHRVFQISKCDQIEALQEAFSRMERIYIADGHHRAASAVKVGLRRRQAHPEYTGEKQFNYFLSVLFPEEELKILPYNRVVRDLNGLTEEAFLMKAGEYFEIEKLDAVPFSPTKKGEFGMYLSGCWYRLTAPAALLSVADPVARLDVSILQDYLLGPVLGIGDPRVDGRIDFVGGIRGLSELKRRAESDMAVAFSMYPTSIGELFEVADEKLLMPPKSTWFEPKLRSGLFIHRIEK